MIGLWHQTTVISQGQASRIKLLAFFTSSQVPQSFFIELLKRMRYRKNS